MANEQRYPGVPLRKVHRMQFGIMSPEEITRMSVTKVIYAQTMERGHPKVQGINCPKMVWTRPPLALGLWMGIALIPPPTTVGDNRP